MWRHAAMGWRPRLRPFGTDKYCCIPKSGVQQKVLLLQSEKEAHFLHRQKMNAPFLAIQKMGLST